MVSTIPPLPEPHEAMSHFSLSRRCAALLLLGWLSGAANAQGFERWFQVEMTVFSNESGAERERENWRAEGWQLAYPENPVRLGQLLDLLLLDSFAPSVEISLSRGAEAMDPEGARLRDTGPHPARGSADFRFPDLQRDAFIALPASYSDFRQTNLAIERAPQHRILYHAVWRQPVGDAGNAIPVLVSGGNAYGPYRELQGSIALEFNANRDRVVFSADLWLATFGGDNEAGWTLPEPPPDLSPTAETANPPVIDRIYPMRQNRDLRSGEFHYLDHPAMGILVQIVPHVVPPPESLPE